MMINIYMQKIRGTLTATSIFTILEPLDKTLVIGQSREKTFNLKRSLMQLNKEVEHKILFGYYVTVLMQPAGSNKLKITQLKMDLRIN